MLFFAEHGFKHEVILQEAGLFAQKFQYLGFGRLQQFRSEEGHGCRHFSHRAAAFIVHGLIFIHPVVFIFFHGRIYKSVFEFLPYGISFPQCCKQSLRRFDQFSAEIFKLFGSLYTLVYILFPQRLIRIHILYVPFVFLRYLISLF